MPIPPMTNPPTRPKPGTNDPKPKPRPKPKVQAFSTLDDLLMNQTADVDVEILWPEDEPDEPESKEAKPDEPEPDEGCSHQHMVTFGVGLEGMDCRDTALFVTNLVDLASMFSKTMPKLSGDIELLMLIVDDETLIDAGRQKFADFEPDEGADGA